MGNSSTLFAVGVKTAESFQLWAWHRATFSTWALFKTKKTKTQTQNQIFTRLDNTEAEPLWIAQWPFGSLCQFCGAGVFGFSFLA